MLEIVIRASARCLLCGDEVVGVDGGLLSYCSCGELAVDGPSSGRIVGNPANYENTSVMELDTFAIQLIDLAGAADEHRPTDAEIADAPYLGEWAFSLYPGTELVCMTGFAIGHPRLGTTTVTTRPLVAVDVEAGWVRTQGRVYRLGDRR